MTATQLQLLTESLMSRAFLFLCLFISVWMHVDVCILYTYARIYTHMSGCRQHHIIAIAQSKQCQAAYNNGGVHYSLIKYN